MLALITAVNLISANISTSNCVDSIEYRLVRGTSLKGIAEDRDRVKILRGYYTCNPVHTGDIVAYSYAGRTTPLLKVVRGLPGDRFTLQARTNGWRLLVNNKEVCTSRGEAYHLDSQAHEVLSLYEETFKGIIPKDSYLILGNLPEGTLDSTRFGLIHNSDLLGRAFVVH